MILTGGDGGGDLLHAAIQPVQTVYDPVYGSEIDAEFFWRLVPDAYRIFEDRDQIETLWKGLILLFSREVLAAYQADATKSLSIFPPEWQRKWVELRYLLEEGFKSKPSLLATGLDRYTVDTLSARLNSTWVTRPDLDRTYLPLRGAHNHKATVRWGARLQIDSEVGPDKNNRFPRGALAYVGYLNQDSTDLSNSLLVGLGIGEDIPEGKGTLIIAQYPASGIPNFAISSHIVDADQAYEIRAEYSGERQEVIAELRKYTADGDSVVLEPVTTLTLRLQEGGSDPTFMVDAFGVANLDTSTDEQVIIGVGDAVVDGGSLLDTILFRDTDFDFQGLDTQIGDVVEITGVPTALTVAGVVDANTVQLSARIALTTLNAPYKIRSVGRILKEMQGFSISPLITTVATGYVSDWLYADPFLASSLLHCPRLTDKILVPTTTLTAELDYTLEGGSVHFGEVPDSMVVGTEGTWIGSLPSSLFQDLDADFTAAEVAAGESILVVDSHRYLVTAVLADNTLSIYPSAAAEGETTKLTYRVETPTTSLWAEYSTYDEGVLGDHFGTLVGLPLAKATPQDLAQVRGLYYALFRGGRVTDIRRGVHILLGLPISFEGGTVTAVNTAYSGQKGLISIESAEGVVRQYAYPLLLGTTIVVGAVVPAFEPLCNGVEIFDHINNPTWWLLAAQVGIIHELQKYHTFQVRVDTRAASDSFELLDEVLNFTDRISDTWKDVFTTVEHDIRDDVDRPAGTLNFGLTSAFVDSGYGAKTQVVYLGKRTINPPNVDFFLRQGKLLAWPGMGSLQRPALLLGHNVLEYPDDPCVLILTQVAAGPPLITGVDGLHPDDLDADGTTQFFDSPGGFFVTNSIAQYDVLEVGAARYIIKSVTSESRLVIQNEVAIAAGPLVWTVYTNSTVTSLT